MENHRTDDTGSTYRDGMRAAMPLVPPTFLLAVSFGVAARALGWGAVAPVVMSIVVFSGSAQFASTGVLAAGGSIGAAALSAALVNLRFLPLGLAAAPAMRGRALRRAAEGQAVVDASVVLARTPDGRISRGRLFGSTLPQALAWFAGTAVGAVLNLGADAQAYGVDAIFPAFFLTILAAELRGPAGPTSRRVALAGAAIALVMVPLVPPGIPVVTASLAAVLGLRR